MQDVIDYLYSVVNISKFRYKILEFEEDLDLISDNYFLSPNFSGLNCLMIFVEINKKNHSYLIDKNTLKYRRSHVVLEDVKSYPINVKLERTIYYGSVFDGILVQQKNKKLFIITDVYQFRGKNIEDEKINLKLMNIKTYFDSVYNPSSSNDIEISINKLYPITHIEKMVTVDIPKNKTIPIRGIVFYPEISDTKLIFLFNNKIKSDEVKKEVRKPKIRLICKTDEPVIITFEMRKTNIPDVYKLFLIEEIKREGKKVLMCKKIDIAYIPTKQCSFMCRELIKMSSNEKVLMNCKYDKEKEKWVPIGKETTKKIPSFVSEIEAKMDIIEDFSDND